MRLVTGLGLGLAAVSLAACGSTSPGASNPAAPTTPTAPSSAPSTPGQPGLSATAPHPPTATPSTGASVAAGGNGAAAQALALKIDKAVWSGDSTTACGGLVTDQFRTGLVSELSAGLAQVQESVPTTCAGAVKAYGAFVAAQKIDWTFKTSKIVSKGDATWVVSISYKSQDNTPDRFTVVRQSSGSLVVTDHEDDATTQAGSAT